MADYDSNKQIHSLERYKASLTKNSLVLSQDEIGNRLGASEFIDLIDTITLDDINNGILFQHYDLSLIEASAAAAIDNNDDLGRKSSGLDQFATTDSEDLRSTITDATGSGSLVFSNSPVLTSPVLGTATGTSFNSITGLSDELPWMDSESAYAGTDTEVSRADHVHPSDDTKQDISEKDQSNGYTGLTLLKINFMNALGTIKSFFTNENTVARTYTFQNRNGTIADDTDLSDLTTYVDNYKVAQTAGGGADGAAVMPTWRSAYRDADPTSYTGQLMAWNTDIGGLEIYYGNHDAESYWMNLMPFYWNRVTNGDGSASSIVPANRSGIACNNDTYQHYMTLPASPNVNDYFSYYDYTDSFETNPMLINGNGNTVEGHDSYTIDINGQGGTLVYQSNGWRHVNVYQGMTRPKPLSNFTDNPNKILGGNIKNDTGTLQTFISAYSCLSDDFKTELFNTSLTTLSSPGALRYAFAVKLTNGTQTVELATNLSGTGLSAHIGKRLLGLVYGGFSSIQTDDLIIFGKAGDVVISTGITTVYSTITYPAALFGSNAIATSLIKEIEYGVRDTVVASILVTIDGTNNAFFIGTSAAVAFDDAGSSAWGLTSSAITSMVPFNVDYKFKSTSGSTVDLLCHKLRIRR